MVMELLDGYTLTGYIKANNLQSMAYPMANKIITEIGGALQQVHAKMLLHRDVGPDNIILTKDGSVHLIDFGATRMYALNSPKSMSILVKPGFAPIEQYSRAGNQGPWTDVYALAATYYFLVAGKKPPEAPDRIAGAALIPLKNLNYNIPQQINDAIAHGLEENWRKRPQNIRDFLMEMGLLKDASQVGKHVWGWQHTMDDPGKTLKPEVVYQRKPCVLLQIGNQRTRYYFMQDHTLTIGRSSSQSNIVLKDNQVSGLHCKLWYDAVGNRFMLENYSTNRTYTSQGILEKGQGTYLVRSEWLYIQTVNERYIFYLEVE